MWNKKETDLFQHHGKFLVGFVEFIEILNFSSFQAISNHITLWKIKLTHYFQENIRKYFHYLHHVPAFSLLIWMTDP